jgi:hypothetical protein
LLLVIEIRKENNLTNSLESSKYILKGLVWIDKYKFNVYTRLLRFLFILLLFLWWKKNSFLIQFFHASFQLRSVLETSVAAEKIFIINILHTLTMPTCTHFLYPPKRTFFLELLLLL